MRNKPFIFFDLDDTLLNHTVAQERGVKEIHKKYFRHFPYMEFEKVWMKHAQKYWKLYEQKKLSFIEQRIKRFIATWKELGKPISVNKAKDIVNEYAALYEFFWKPFPKVVSTIKKLHQRGFPLGILTNGSTHQQLKKLKKLKLNQYFKADFIITSETSGFSKPAKEIYLHAESLIRTSGSNVIFISNDIFTDLETAKNMGWEVILFDYFNRFPDHSSVKRFQDILQLI